MAPNRTPLDSDCNGWIDSTAEMKSECRSLGFPLVGITDLLEPPRYQAFESWLERGFHGSMKYLETRKEAYRHACSVMDGCKRVIMLGVPYSKTESKEDESTSSSGQSESHREDEHRALGKVAQYASGRIDYHDWIHSRLKLLRKWIQERHPGAAVRGVVDTAPILEREFAQLSGIGWIGKNTLLLTRTHGSNFFLAALLTDVPFQPDQPFESDHCGSCRACLDVCPTRAFPEPYVLDATRCISYLTIEHRGPIALDLHEGLQDWVFGCDACQEVCPWNRRPSPQIEEQLQSRNDHNQLSIIDLLKLNPDTFRSRFRKTPLDRPKLEGILRNAAIVAGNLNLQEAVPHLQTLIETTQDPAVQIAASEALRKIVLLKAHEQSVPTL